MSSKAFFFILVMAWVITQAAAMGPRLAPAAERVRFAVSFRWAPPYLLVNEAMKEKGFWKKLGLEVEWMDLTGSRIMHQGLASGSVDIGIEDVPGTVVAITGGSPELMVARWESQPNYSIWVLANSRFAKPEDIKGGRIGVGRIGDTPWAQGVMALRRVGISEKDVRFVGVGGQPERVAALKAGVVDAFVQAYNTNVDLVARGEIKGLINIGDYLPQEWIEGVFSARSAFLEKNPETVIKVIQGVVEAQDFVRANRPWAAERLIALLRFSPAGAKLAVDEKILYPRLGAKISRQALQNVVNFMVEYGLIKKEKVPPLDKMVHASPFTW